MRQYMQHLPLWQLWIINPSPSIGLKRRFFLQTIRNVWHVCFAVQCKLFTIMREMALKKIAEERETAGNPLCF